MKSLGIESLRELFSILENTALSIAGIDNAVNDYLERQKPDKEYKNILGFQMESMKLIELKILKSLIKKCGYGRFTISELMSVHELINVDKNKDIYLYYLEGTNKYVFIECNQLAKVC
ncbi:hypothetical protein SH1V18_48000 [Vallitalea longa]|uniref:Uncharacterized protein n=1 Tax=Vallitalea longa TaxID=2936439 RepID=A0A9W5YDX4_9FIRM|nr:hypothetical protein [Vallitalea longa]GKX32320.1 hypothetical protein SH1V18_48000 [Vallitalea longa]